MRGLGAEKQSCTMDKFDRIYQLDHILAGRRTPVVPFDEEYDKALLKPLHASIPLRFVSIPTLIAMKEAAGRKQDEIDIEYLRMRQADESK